LGLDRTFWPLEQGTWLESKNNWPVTRTGALAVAAFPTLTCVHSSGRWCGLISATTLLHSLARVVFGESTSEMWISWNGLPSVTLWPQVTLSAPSCLAIKTYAFMVTRVPSPRSCSFERSTVGPFFLVAEFASPKLMLLSLFTVVCSFFRSAIVISFGVPLAQKLFFALFWLASAPPEPGRSHAASM